MGEEKEGDLNKWYLQCLQPFVKQDTGSRKKNRIEEITDSKVERQSQIEKRKIIK